MAAHPTIKAGSIEIEYRQYVLNEKQQFAVLAQHPEQLGATMDPDPGIEYQWLGKLSEQSTIFAMQIGNSLVAEHWDFNKYPDPEILLITRTEDVPQVPIMPWEEPGPWDEMEERTCRQCGCSEDDACVHPQYGPCWWVEDDLCSHCQNWPGESTRPGSILQF